MSEEKEDENSGKLKSPVALPDLSSIKNGAGKAAGIAKSFGVGKIVQSALSRYFTKKVSQLRPDQLETILNDGVMLADMIDENDPHENITRPIEIASMFMSREKMIQAFGTMINPQMVQAMIKEGAPEAYKHIINHPGGGKRWFFSQTKYLKEKIRRVMMNYG